MPFVYILLCKDGSLYTGATKNLLQRLRKHRKKTGAKYTRSRLPVRLIYTEFHKNYSLALSREIEIKNLPRFKKKELIKSRFLKKRNEKNFNKLQKRFYLTIHQS